MPQFMMPSRYVPALRSTLLHHRATIVAQSLLGPAAKMLFDHALLKPPLEGPATPWHQDGAFHRRGHRYRTLTLWMPLHDVDEESGCLRFVPGSHLGGVHSHRHLGDDARVHALEAVEPDLTGAVYAPLPAGGISVHDDRILHGAGPNRSDRPRRAYAMVFGVRTTTVQGRQHGWNVGAPTAHERRYRATRTPTQRLRAALLDTARTALR